MKGLKTTQREKIFTVHITDKELVSRMYKELFQIKKKKKINIIEGQETLRHFKEEDTQMAIKNMKKNSTLLVMREMR